MYCQYGLTTVEHICVSLGCEQYAVVKSQVYLHRVYVGPWTTPMITAENFLPCFNVLITNGPFYFPQASYESFTEKLPEHDCRYGIYDYDYTDSEGCQKSKIVFFAW